eukprot:Skav218689  [mRNA]  locus=scaffold4775:79741:83578:+ [translate_table: standard]
MSPKRKSLDAPKDALDVTNLADEWDGCEDIRGRLRNGETFLHPNFSTENVKGCIYNSSILVPLLTRMSIKDDKPLPAIQELRDEIGTLFEKNKRGSSPEDGEAIIQSGWSVKKCCGFELHGGVDEEDAWDEEGEEDLKEDQGEEEEKQGEAHDGGQEAAQSLEQENQEPTAEEKVDPTPKVVPEATAKTTKPKVEQGAKTEEQQTTEAATPSAPSASSAAPESKPKGNQAPDPPGVSKDVASRKPSKEELLKLRQEKIAQLRALFGCMWTAVLFSSVLGMARFRWGDFQKHIKVAAKTGASEESKSKKRRESKAKKRTEITIPEAPGTKADMVKEISEWLTTTQEFSEDEAKDKIKVMMPEFFTGAYMDCGPNVYWVRKEVKGIGCGVKSRKEGKDVAFFGYRLECGDMWIPAMAAAIKSAEIFATSLN